MVVSRDASPSERHAARELEQCLFEMTGARLPVAGDRDRVRGPTILLGRSEALEALGVKIPWEELGDERFTLKTVGNHLVIAGGRRRGTLYGVYEFLERLGCRWYTPDFTVTPRGASPFPVRAGGVEWLRSVDYAPLHRDASRPL